MYAQHSSSHRGVAMAPAHGKVTQERRVNRLFTSPGLGVINVDHVGWAMAVLWVRVRGCIPDNGSRPSEGQAERYFHVLTKAVGMRE